MSDIPGLQHYCTSNQLQLQYRFHSVDKPLIDPVQQRIAQHNAQRSPESSRASSMVEPTKPYLLTQKWIRFSSSDNDRLEQAFQAGTPKKVLVNEDQLFEVDIDKRTISAAYWESAVYKVCRASWFTRGKDGSQWMPCDEDFAKKIEEGYRRSPTSSEYKPWKTDVPDSDSLDSDDKPSYMPGFDGLDTPLSLEDAVTTLPEMKWQLDPPNHDDYIVYTSADTAWLLSYCGTRLIRGYPEVKPGESVGVTSMGNERSPTSPSNPVGPMTEKETQSEIEERQKQRKQEMEDYENENADKAREIDHLIICIHGIGQKMTERLGQSFVHDVNVIRRTLKEMFPTAIAMTSNPKKKNGIQVLPILWRHQIKFGLGNDDEDEQDEMHRPGMREGQPTIDDLTIEGVKPIRNIVSDVLLDIPLYMTKYREQMLSIISQEINRVFHLFLRNNPDFLAKGGKVSILGHSLGSCLAFDLLTLQPFDAQEKARVNAEHERRHSYVSSQYKPTDILEGIIPPLNFDVQNLFCIGSPVGIFLLIRGSKIASRKMLAEDQIHLESPSGNPVCYPACSNIYNIFYRSDPVAFRLEPLIARHFTAHLKPEPIPYHKGGLKGIFDASYTVTSDIANRAEAVLESLKSSATSWFRREELSTSPDGTELTDEPEEITLSTLNTNLEKPNSEPTSPMISKSDDLLRKAQGSSVKSTGRSKSDMRAYVTGAERLKMLNSTGRVDYFIQEGILENSYLSALQSHLVYWKDTDVAAFLIRSIYK
ncbi:hypothetical protein NQZ79_g1067 [Umbelopsis isabellina]|nr:hypothetical protein NQZ79_g1067 [Umbelopsis isabellina]